LAVTFGQLADVMDHTKDNVSVRTALGQARRSGASAFTLLELLVVIAIMAIIVSTSLPALKGLGRAGKNTGAARQVLEDLRYARQVALRNRSDVYMVFTPSNIWSIIREVDREKLPPRKKDPRMLSLTNMIEKQYSGYAIVSMRTVGDQPGQKFPNYLTEWKNLPSGMMIAPHKITQAGQAGGFQLQSVPFPISDSSPAVLPVVGFNSRGQLKSGREEIIPLVSGNVMHEMDRYGNYRPSRADVQVTGGYSDVVENGQYKPAYHHKIRINSMTGRARLEEWAGDEDLK